MGEDFGRGIILYHCAPPCLWPPAAGAEDAIQAIELAQKASVGDDASMVLHCLDGLHQGHILSDHQVSQHKCGWSTDANCAVHQDFPCKKKSNIDNFIYHNHILHSLPWH